MFWNQEKKDDRAALRANTKSRFFFARYPLLPVFVIELLLESKIYFAKVWKPVMAILDFQNLICISFEGFDKRNQNINSPPPALISWYFLFCLP